MKTDHQNWEEDEDTVGPIRTQQKWSELVPYLAPCGDLATGQQILFPIDPVTLRQPNGNLGMFGPMEAKSCKSTKRSSTKLIQVGLPPQWHQVSAKGFHQRFQNNSPHRNPEWIDWPHYHPALTPGWHLSPDGSKPCKDLSSKKPKVLHVCNDFYFSNIDSVFFPWNPNNVKRLHNSSVEVYTTPSPSSRSLLFFFQLKRVWFPPIFPFHYFNTLNGFVSLR